jgi:hypothetical protein
MLTCLLHQASLSCKAVLLLSTRTETHTLNGVGSVSFVSPPQSRQNSHLLSRVAAPCRHWSMFCCFLRIMRSSASRNGSHALRQDPLARDVAGAPIRTVHGSWKFVNRLARQTTLGPVISTSAALIGKTPGRTSPG